MGALMVEAATIFGGGSAHSALENLALMAAEVGMNPRGCLGTAAMAFNCADLLKDFAFVPRANGVLDKYPLVALNIAAFERFRDMKTHLDESNNNDPSWFDTYGWPGAGIWQLILASASGKRTSAGPLDRQSVGMLPPTFVEYSAHDTTLNTFFAATGNATYAYPVFGAAVVVEVYGRNATAANASVPDDENFFARPLYGYPNQVPSTSRDPNQAYSYVWEPFAITCQRADGSVYRTTAGCVLADWKRFADTRTATDPCVADPADLAAQFCDPVTHPDAPPVGPLGDLCRRYRQACPFVACGSGAYLTADLKCNQIPQS